MEDIELISYAIVFALSAFFSSLAVDRKSSVFCWLSGVCWFTLSATHASLTQTSTFLILAWMFVALGFIFVLYGFSMIFLSFRIRKKEKEWEIT
jgi:hypothetical protein